MFAYTRACGTEKLISHTNTFRQVWYFAWFAKTNKYYANWKRMAAKNTKTPSERCAIKSALGVAWANLFLYIFKLSHTLDVNSQHSTLKFWKVNLKFSDVVTYKWDRFFSEHNPYYSFFTRKGILLKLFLMNYSWMMSA